VNLWSKANQQATRRGFTLVELLVVFVLVMFGMGLLLPTVGRIKGRGSVVQCLNNAKQLAFAADLYAVENNDLWPANGLSDAALNLANPPGSYVPRVWVEGRESSNVPSQESADGMISERTSLLAGYVRDRKVFVCPAEAPIVAGNRSFRRTRSFGMNQFVGWTPDIYTPAMYHGEPNSSSKVFTKTASTEKPGDIFLFGEIHPYSICKPAFGTHPRWNSEGEPTGANVSFHVPGSNHGRSTVFSMADGHAEVRRWRSARFNDPYVAGRPVPENDGFWHIHDTPLPGVTAAQVAPDFKWLTVHTTVRR
jgi:type II secretory pathway pseudopilin PulG